MTARSWFVLLGPAEHIVHLFYLIQFIIVLGVIADRRSIVAIVYVVANLVEDSIETFALPLLQRPTFGA